MSLIICCKCGYKTDIGKWTISRRKPYICSQCQTRLLIASRMARALYETTKWRYWNERLTA